MTRKTNTRVKASCSCGFICVLAATASGFAEDRAWLIGRVDAALFAPLTAKGHNNDAGGIAWGDSYAMMACVEMLQATGEPRYADRMIALANRVLAERDDVRKVKDEYRDRVVPAWSSTAYTEGKRYA